MPENQKKLNQILKKGEPVLWLLLSVTLIFLLFLFCHGKAPFLFQTNDDELMESIASGSMTGKPEARLIFIGYPIGLFLAGLYRMAPAVPWYGLLLYVCLGVSMAGILYMLLSRTNGILTKIILIVLYLVGAYSFVFFDVIYIQFTVVSSALAALALVLLLFYEPSENGKKDFRKNIALYISVFLSFNVRNESFLMVLPFMALFLGYKWILAGGNGKIRIRKMNGKQKNIIFTGIMIAGILLVSFCIQKIAYSSPEWRDYLKFSKARAKIVDYTDFPEYSSHSELYRELNIKEEDYKALDNYSYLFTDSSSTEVFRAIVKYTKKENALTLRTLPDKLRSMLDGFVESHFKWISVCPLCVLVYFMYACSFLLSIIGKKKQAFYENVLALVGRTVVWLYIIYSGRVPMRIIQSVFFVEAALLLAVIGKNELWKGRVRKKVVFILGELAILGFAFLSYYLGMQRSSAIASETKSMAASSQAFEELMDYMRGNPDCFYYINVLTLDRYFKESLSLNDKGYDNYIYSGGWLTNSPYYKDKLARAGITDVTASLYDNPDVYIVFLDDGGSRWNYLAMLLERQHGNKTLKIVEEFPAYDNMSFLILKAYDDL